ncbi:23S rRNA (uracil(1939)-C(5))-methyltransferase RlmD [Catenovulum sp. 2E275]|uniref:23S rRNA (uracil(1939)-C(5))-methyltransferase RlmD n=1 Tax=Catenovulum sp. 2E275 TaxID=2980497 RepID=UPI0021D0934C|nr:23S rRNA (uracil(1939)-C(5))-methyltransferase RlmD [Catenovulum sp. 2E275]MCU4676122.1 23S rRNA (uracil(1939)-C(5))-methyltransferase RlmD [Catenovulum sp. 2E275]
MVKIFKSNPHIKSTKPKNIELDINGLDHLGRGVGRLNGKVCFVRGALPQERVTARMIDDKKQFILADLVKVIQPSPDRVKPECKWFNQCGGCQLQHLSADKQLVEKQHRITHDFAKTGIDNLPWQPALSGEPWGYRTRTRLSAWYEGKQDKLRVGFRQFNSKKLVEVDTCLVIAPQFSSLLPQLVQVLNRLTDKKQITHLELNSASEHKLIVLRVLKSLQTTDLAILDSFASEHKLSIFFQFDDHRFEALNNTQAELFYRVDDLIINFGLGDFTQVNSQLNLAMIKQAINWLELNDSDVVLDLFCGLGNFTLPVAQKVQKVLGIEGSKLMVEKSQINASVNKLTNTQFIARDLSCEDALDEVNLSEFNKIILDPSREGAQTIVQNSHKWDANLVLYIACEPSALVRDSQTLINNGYTMAKIGLIDMFTQTSHIETMALFSRGKAK